MFQGLNNIAKYYVGRKALE